MKNHTLIKIMVAFMLATVFIASASAKDNLKWSNKIMGTGVIYQVVDGDTIWINVDNQNTFNRFIELADTSDKKKALRKNYKSIKIRIANINTAESVHRDKSKNSKAGKNASNYLKSIASKAKAQFICWDHGKYGRPICSVEFKDNTGNVDIAYRMISQGYSDYVTAWGKHPYAHKDYAKAAR